MHVHCPSKALAAHTKNSVDTPWGMGTLAHATMFFAAIGPSLSSNGGTLDTMPMASAMPWLGNFPIEKKRCPPPTLPACRLQCTFAPRIFCPPCQPTFFALHVANGCAGTPGGGSGRVQAGPGACPGAGAWAGRGLARRKGHGQAGGLVRRKGHGQAGGLHRCTVAGRRPGPASGWCRACTGANAAGPRQILLPTL